MSLYTTLAAIKDELNANRTTDDQEVLRIANQVSRRIDDLFHFKNLFVPTIQTRRVGLTGLNINSTDGTFNFGRPLLSLSGVSVSGSALVIGTNVQTYPIDSVPYFELQLIGSACGTWYNVTCTDARGPQFASIGGVWGYNSDYANAWLDVDTLSANITDSVTTLTVSDVDGTDPDGNSPRISAGMVLQIDDEWMDVIGTTVLTNTVTVKRGVNGSTAAAHTMGATVSVFQVEDSIKRAVTRQTCFQYARQGAYETRRMDGIATIQYPSDMLDEVNGLLALFANMG